MSPQPRRGSLWAVYDSVATLAGELGVSVVTVGERCVCPCRRVWNPAKAFEVGGRCPECRAFLFEDVEAVEQVRLEQGVRPIDTVPTGRKV